MLEINWIITDDLSSVTPEVFDTEWCGIIGGWVEFIINEQKEGYCPQRKEEGEEGLEDVLYWLICLSEGVEKIKANEQYEMTLLTRNQYKLLLQPDIDDVKISFINVATHTVKWTERIELKEFAQEIQKSIDKFIGIIEETNPILLKSKWLRKLYE